MTLSAARAAPLLLAALAATAQQHAAGTDVTTFACTAGGLELIVQAQPPSFTYTVFSALTGAAWLEGGSIALLQAGSYLTPGAGLTGGAPLLGSGADALGAFTYCAVPWVAAGVSAPFTANFTCYDEHMAFALHFPEGYSFASPQQTALPATHFPQWLKTASTLGSPATGFVEWAGEMDTYGNTHGVGLQGYQGGVESGPLLLYNVSQLALGGALPQALVLGPGSGPGTHVAHGVLGVVRDPAPAPPTAPSWCSSSGLDCYAAPHTDKEGGNLAPGIPGGGLLVQGGNASACCAACAALGQLCDSWVYDTDGTAGGNNCWPLLGVTGSTPGAANRVLGLAPWVAPTCPQPTLDTVPAASTPSLGFEAGVANSTPGACCRLCGTLGLSSCSAWVLHSATGLCFPLLTASQNHTPAPGLLTGAAPASLPMVLAAGVQGRISTLPPRFASVWWLAGAATGLNDAVMSYGWALRRVAGLQRLDKALDPQRNLLTFWSDNGAFYFDGYWPQFFNATSNTAQDVFLALKAYHAQLGLVVGSYQMDPWWYGGSCGSSGPPPPQCTDAAWPWSSNWSAAPGFFPDGGLGALGLPLTLYSNLFAQAPLNAMGQFEWVNCSSCRGGTPPYARVAVEQAYDFHSYLFDAGAAWGMNAFEVDFSDFMFEGFADFATDVRAFDAYWEGVNRASAEHSFPTQLCMTLPAITLSTPQWSHITNARLQGDGYVTNTQRYIFQTSLLYASLELAPFLDNVWTVGCQPAWDNAFGNATCEQHSEGLIAIATLSSGPVGFGDRVGFTNASLLNMTCRSDGVLLQPSLPAVNLEAYYGGALAPAGSRARIASAPSFISAAATGAATSAAAACPYPVHLRSQPLQGTQYTFLTVLATFVESDVVVAAGDVWRGGSAAVPQGPPLGFYAQQLSRANQCTEGVPAAGSGGGGGSGGCAVHSPGGPSDALLTANTGAQGHELYSIAPVLPGGWVVLGELSKFTRHSPERLMGVDPGCSGRHPQPSLCLQVVGGVGEVVELAFVDPNGLVRLASLVVDSQGGAAVACTCSGAAAALGAGNCACTAEAK